MFLKQLNNNFNFNLANSEFKSQNLCIKAVTTFLTSKLDNLHVFTLNLKRRKKKNLLFQIKYFVYSVVSFMSPHGILSDIYVLQIKW